MDMCYDGALVLPSSYAVMDEEEMCYTEGGKFYGVNLNKKQCSSVAYTLTVFSGILSVSSLTCTVLALIPGLQGALVGAKYYGALSTAFGLSSWLFTEGEKHGGMYIGFEFKKEKMGLGYVDIRDKNV